MAKFLIVDPNHTFVFVIFHTTTWKVLCAQGISCHNVELIAKIL